AAALRIDYKGPESLRSYLEEEAARKGFRPNFVKFEGRHIVFDISLIGQKDSAAQGFWATLLLIYILDKLTERKTERLEYVVLFDEVGVLDTLGIGDVLNRILKDMVRGGRKYGFAVWFVIQSATMLDRMLLETASIVLVLGGPMRSLKHSVDVLVLSPSDISYLTSALTPYETSLGGQPYAMGVLLLSPREIKYHVKIPLDPQLKPPRK
ncbi:MAG: hypothetical protein QXT13_11265, partial [Pyrobaculum sp.]